MTSITTKEQFDGLLREEQAVLFTFFDWSGQAHSSLRVFEEWEREWRALHSVAPVSFYRLDPDSYRESWDWLVEQARGSDGMEGGYGSVTWLRRGKNVGFVRYAAKVGKDTLSHLTDDYFGSVIAA
jgi:hypothetical protein